MVELYDLEKDPFELNNIADIQEHVVKSKYLAKQLVKWQKETKDHPWWMRRRADKNDRISGYPLFNEVPELITY